MSEAVTSAGTSLGCHAGEAHTFPYSGCAARLLSMTVAGPRTVGACHSERQL